MSNSITWGGWGLDVVNQQLTAADSAAISLSPRFVDITAALLRAADQAISRQQLMRQVYGEHPAIGLKGLDMNICKLRKQLARAGFPTAIVTLYCYGFRMRRVADSATLPRLNQKSNYTQRLFYDA